MKFKMSLKSLAKCVTEIALSGMILGGLVLSTSEINKRTTRLQDYLNIQKNNVVFVDVNEARRYVEQEKKKLGLEDVQTDVVFTNQLIKPHKWPLNYISKDMVESERLDAYCYKKSPKRYALGFIESRSTETADHEIYHLYQSEKIRGSCLGFPEFMRPFDIFLALREYRATKYAANKEQRQAEIQRKMQKGKYKKKSF